MILPEARLIGCPIYAATQANIQWKPGHYFSFQAAKSGVITNFMWQTQGARKHWDPTDGHSGGNFGCYTVKFYRCNDWTQPKGVQLAAGKITSGLPGYYPGRQVGGYDSLNTASPKAGVWNSPELVGGLHVHAWGSRAALNANNVLLYCGTAFVHVDVTAYGAPWKVTAGEWILVEFINLAASPTLNFSLDNNAFSAAAAHPGKAASQSPLDRLLSVREYIASTEQPSMNGGARGMVPFYLTRYDDGKWYGQPWYYRGRYPGGSSGEGLFDENATNPTAAPLPVATRGPALLVFGKRRLRQVLTPSTSFPAARCDALYVHGWRWTSLARYTSNKRLGVRILRVSSTSSRTLSPATQLWPPVASSGSDVFRVGKGASSGPFKAFPAGTFAAFGQTVVAGTTLTITPSNLSSRTSPTLTQFEAAVPTINYGRLAISPSIEISPLYRYVIEIVAEGGAAYAMQMQKNPHRYVNLQRKQSDGKISTSQGRAFRPDGSQPGPISMPQVWPCHPTSVPTVTEDNALNSGRYYNACGKLYDPAFPWTEINDHMLPISLMPEA